ncbi:helix-turn-helix domain-containing protein [Pyrococcus sp. ST04]|uniref:helix-turn-helix transcriptional regulator n=1 Tax=Pyrococcus sp. ST04 TaxID=1183377 RepID=UPI0002605C7A|nr:MarR family transcriptional regulator [Pyrococcus sp. ST04]AFK22370.1 putative transcriptional regulator, IclR family [Pyrococcus sp. ST04]
MRKALLALILFLFLPLASAGNVTIKVFPDGYALVKLVMNVSAGENVSIQLPVYNFENLSVKLNGREVSFLFSNNGIVIYPGEPGKLEVSYLTPNLTSKTGKVWKIDLPFNETKTVILPQDSVIVGLSGIPLRIRGNSVIMPRGRQYIEYVFPHQEIVTVTLTTTSVETVTVREVTTLTETVTKTVRETVEKTSKAGIIVGIILGALIIALPIFGRRILEKRKLSGSLTLKELAERFNLNEDERAVIMYIAEHGGEVRQADIRNELGIPRTTTWRILKRLERLGILTLKKVNNETWAKLNINVILDEK